MSSIEIYMDAYIETMRDFDEKIAHLVRDSANGDALMKNTLSRSDMGIIRKKFVRDMLSPFLSKKQIADLERAASAKTAEANKGK
jgi:hypothetical protein